MRRWLLRIFGEHVVLSVISFNLLVLFLRAYPSVRANTTLDSALFAIDYACLIYFVFEIWVKVRLFGWPLFWAKAMNRFDLAIVVMSAPTLVTAFTNMEELSIILVLRAGRLLRFLRVLRFIPHADELWAGILRALRASVGLILALALYNLVLGLIAAHLFGHIAPKHFADPMTSVYTMFKVFTVEGWYEIPDLIVSRSSPEMGVLARVFFVFSVLTGGILGLSITNAALVDEMVMDNNDDLRVELATVRSELAALSEAQASQLGALNEKLAELLERDSGS